VRDDGVAGTGDRWAGAAAAAPPWVEDQGLRVDLGHGTVAQVQRRKLELKQNLKAEHRILVSKRLVSGAYSLDLIG